jgi:hypothetical protein
LGFGAFVNGFQPLTTRPHFELATRLFSLVLSWANLLLQQTKQVFATRECLSRVHLRNGGAATKKIGENRG